MIEIEDYLKVQGYGRKDKKRYVRIALPVETADDNDIRPKDLLKIVIVEHVKIGRRKKPKQIESAATAKTR